VNLFGATEAVAAPLRHQSAPLPGQVSPISAKGGRRLP
jgi:hypothetical protein